jgi:hypothetical protein
MSFVVSRDGTRIAYDRAGDGPAVIVVGGALVDRAENSPLAAALSTQFSVFNYDRRGRGKSGDALPYAVQREIEDLAALIEHAGGPVAVYGVSSGGALAIEATAAGLPIEKLALYEVPYAIGEEMRVSWRAYVDELHRALAARDRPRALELFMRLAGSSEADVAGARRSAAWPALLQLAPTLAYDAACLGDGGLPANVALVRTSTLVLTGSTSQADPHMQELAPDYFTIAADALASSLQKATRETLHEQSHTPSAAVLASRLARFFGE